MSGRTLFRLGHLAGRMLMAALEFSSGHEAGWMRIAALEISSIGQEAGWTQLYHAFQFKHS
jgi:hypothetical protein